MCLQGQGLEYMTPPSMLLHSSAQHTAPYTAPRRAPALQQQAQALRAPSLQATSLPSARQSREPLYAAASSASEASSATALVLQKSAAKRRVREQEPCGNAEGVMSHLSQCSSRSHQASTLNCTWYGAGGAACTAERCLPIQSERRDGACSASAHSRESHQRCWQADAGTWPGHLGGGCPDTPSAICALEGCSIKDRFAM